MNSRIRVDTNHLREHISLVQEEQRLAWMLADQLSRACTLADPENVHQIQMIRDKAEQLSHNLSITRDALEHTADIFEKLDKDIAMLLRSKKQ